MKNLRYSKMYLWHQFENMLFLLTATYKTKIALKKFKNFFGSYKSVDYEIFIENEFFTRVKKVYNCRQLKMFSKNKYLQICFENIWIYLQTLKFALMLIIFNYWTSSLQIEKKSKLFSTQN